MRNRKSKQKSRSLRKKIAEALEIIAAVGLPLEDLTPRRLERVAIVFLALCDIGKTTSWSQAKSVGDRRILRTREIIEYANLHLEENISPSSYDDIRRKDLVRLVGMGLVIKSAGNPNADTNDGTRGYSISDKFAELIRSYNTGGWKEKLRDFEIDSDYINQFESKRNCRKLEVTVEEGVVVSLDDGPHNRIQKAIVESFLPIFGYGARLLYIGDTSEKQMLKYSETMREIGLDIEDRGMLPDIIAFSEEKQWVYLIEAVHSSNPLNPERCIELKRTVLRKCKYGVVFVTAFLSRKDFAKWMPHIAWETEVWLAENPEHMIHFNGDRFMGPHDQAPHFD